MGLQNFCLKIPRPKSWTITTHLFLGYSRNVFKESWWANSSHAAKLDLNMLRMVIRLEYFRLTVDQSIPWILVGEIFKISEFTPTKGDHFLALV